MAIACNDFVKTEKNGRPILEGFLAAFAMINFDGIQVKHFFIILKDNGG